MHLLTVLLLAFLQSAFSDPVFYRSSTVPYENLVRQSGEFSMTGDKGETFGVELYLDHAKNIYWYRRLFTEVCLTGECRPIDIGIYWAGSGRYLGIEIFKENLTKTDHSDFSEFDYRKLESVLRDEWSALREFEFEELVEGKKEGVDATTGATKKVIADASVKDAVYTTYTMWHLINVGEGEQIALLTYRYLNEHQEILSAILAQNNPAYLSFLIEGTLSGNLYVNAHLTNAILEGLIHADTGLKNTAFKAIGLLPLDQERVQHQLAIAYKHWNIPDKNRFLQSGNNLTVLYDDLYDVLSADLDQNNAWFLTSLLPVLAKRKGQSEAVLKRIQELEKSGNGQLEEAARKFMSQTGYLK